MTAMVLTRPLAEEFGRMIARLAMHEVCETGLTPEETRDLRSWLQAARQKHWDELREQRSKNWEAAIVRFEKRAASREPSPVAPRGEADFDRTPCA